MIDSNGSESPVIDVNNFYFIDGEYNFVEGAFQWKRIIVLNLEVFVILMWFMTRKFI